MKKRLIGWIAHSYLTTVCILGCPAIQANNTSWDQYSDKKAREEALFTFMENEHVPIAERDTKALDYAKKFNTDLPRWLPYLAIKANLTNLSLYLINQENVPNDILDIGSTVFNQPIFYAMQNGNAAIAKALLDHNVKIVPTGPNQENLLIMLLETMQPSTQFGMPTSLEGIDLEEQKKEDLKRKKVADGQAEILNMLILRGAGVNATVNKNNEIQTPLLKAAISGNEKAVETLLRNGAIANPADNAPLMESLIRGNFDIAKLLILNGAPAQKVVIKKIKYLDADVVKQFSNPLFAAIEGAWINPPKALEVINLLITKGADINATGGLEGINKQTPLSFAIFNGAEDVARLLVGKGADIRKNLSLRPYFGVDEIRAKYFANIPVIHAGAYALMPNLLDDLIKRGIPVTTKSPTGMTPLHTACYQKDPVSDPTLRLQPSVILSRLKNIINLLIRNGVPLNAQDRDGNTALHYLISWAEPDMIRDFLKYNPNISIKNNAGKTALDYVKERQNGEIPFNLKNKLADNIMEKSKTSDWPSDEQLREAYASTWDDIVKTMQSLQ